MGPQGPTGPIGPIGPAAAAPPAAPPEPYNGKFFLEFNRIAGDPMLLASFAGCFDKRSRSLRATPGPSGLAQLVNTVPTAWA